MKATDNPQPHDLLDETDAKLDNDNVVWITREKVLETTVFELEAERNFLREMLRHAMEKLNS